MLLSFVFSQLGIKPNYNLEMERLNTILQEHLAQGQDTKDKLIGAAFVLTNKQGMHPSWHV